MPAPADARLTRYSESATAAVAFLHSVSDLERPERPWPGGPELFQTNPLSLAHGAAGILLTMDAVQGSVPPTALHWLVRAAERRGDLPPGLYLGVAGIAVALARFGEHERAASLLANSANDPLFDEHTDFYHGLSGWGWACLDVYARTGIDRLLEHAVEAGERILSAARRTSAGWAWPTPDGNRVPLGLALGSAGHALFFGQLYARCGEARFEEGARSAIRFEINHADETRHGGISWGRDSDSGGTTPYWFAGAAGTGAALVRLAEALGDPQMRHYAEGAAHGAYYPITANPSLFHGLSGIGQFMLDLAHVAPDPWLDRACVVADAVCCFRLDREEGLLAFPDRRLEKVNCDLGHGTAGIALFLHRLGTRSVARALHDPGA